MNIITNDGIISLTVNVINRDEKSNFIKMHPFAKEYSKVSLHIFVQTYNGFHLILTLILSTLWRNALNNDLNIDSLFILLIFIFIENFSIN